MRRVPLSFGALVTLLALLMGAPAVVGAESAEPQRSLVLVGGPEDALVIDRATGLRPLVSAAGQLGLLTADGIDEALRRLTGMADPAADLGSRRRLVSNAIAVANRLVAEQVHAAGGIRSDYSTALGRLDGADRRRVERATLIRRNTSAVVRLMVSTDWVCPVIGEVRFHDTWGEPRPGDRSHRGVDISAPMNTPIVAPVAGVVSHRWDTIGGRSFDLVADNGDYYFGTHMRRFGIEGRVEAGDGIGFVGAGGNAKGHHLHFEYHPGAGDNAVNPFPLVNTHC